ncbi:hypothetical protein [Alkalilimnicola sp. S0819]|uniref:hypothetical protein n=1 Tax=Alkalilimnicola sp. S0819 TaxID=2613922 RepID=UPI00126236BD|nr:hypothetical protein [Alkalilimnicola sp. S0819]KAB7623814.1 hypothetical protein F3N43_08565 [Alkalilimnicola sp. S0819]MPQ16688.1 hypothetical protein [Alkalilimnicola sp. S0819]
MSAGYPGPLRWQARVLGWLDGPWAMPGLFLFSLLEQYGHVGAYARYSELFEGQGFWVDSARRITTGKSSPGPGTP